jgi:hypothetical protein
MFTMHSFVEEHKNMSQAPALACVVLIAAILASRTVCSEDIASKSTTYVTVEGVVFDRSKLNSFGDFGWMRSQTEYADALFIFNDNEEQFLAHASSPSDRSDFACGAGGGNATIRPWQCETIPRSAGVPTGKLSENLECPGYRALTDDTKAIIDRSIANIKRVMNQYQFRQIFYSSCEKGPDRDCTLDGDLGTSNFCVAEPVRAYIVQSLKMLETSSQTSH